MYNSFTFTSSMRLVKTLMIVGIVACIHYNSHAQGTILTKTSLILETEPDLVNEKPWKYQKKYQSVMTYKFVKDGMSDDEIAGILLYKAGKSFTKSIVYEIIGVVATSIGIYNYPNDKITGTLFSVGGGIFLFAGVVHLFTACNRTANAGIVLMHKGIKVKASPGGVTVNF